MRLKRGMWTPNGNFISARLDFVLCVQSMEFSHYRNGKMFQNHHRGISWGEFCFVFVLIRNIYLYSEEVGFTRNKNK